MRLSGRSAEPRRASPASGAPSAPTAPAPLAARGAGGLGSGRPTGRRRCELRARGRGRTGVQAWEPEGGRGGGRESPTGGGEAGGGQKAPVAEWRGAHRLGPEAAAGAGGAAA